MPCPPKRLWQRKTPSGELPDPSYSTTCSPCWDPVTWSQLHTHHHNLVQGLVNVTFSGKISIHLLCFHPKFPGERSSLDMVRNNTHTFAHTQKHIHTHGHSLHTSSGWLQKETHCLHRAKGLSWSDMAQSHTDFSKQTSQKWNLITCHYKTKHNKSCKGIAKWILSSFCMVAMVFLELFYWPIINYE